MAEAGALGEQGGGGEGAAVAGRADAERGEGGEAEVGVVEDDVGGGAGVAGEEVLERPEVSEAGEVEDGETRPSPARASNCGAQLAGVVGGLPGQVGVGRGEQDDEAEGGGVLGREFGEGAGEGEVVAKVLGGRGGPGVRAGAGGVAVWRGSAGRRGGPCGGTGRAV